MRIYFAIALLLIVSWQSQAQNTFAPIGAEWWYEGIAKDFDYWEPNDTRWADHMFSFKDTVILNRPCRALAATRYLKSDASPEIAAIDKRDTFYIYDNTDTIKPFLICRVV